MRVSNDGKRPGERSSVVEVFLVFLRLGCTCFGGPVAHLGYFHEEFVARRRWLDEAAYADLVALCQFLPGPASSQIGMAVGYTRSGLPGLVAAWLGFTLPSAVLMIGFALGLGFFAGDLGHAGWLRGLKLAAMAVVAQAVWTMAGKLCPDRTRALVALVAAGTALAWHTAVVQIVVIVAGSLAGVAILGRGRPTEVGNEPPPTGDAGKPGATGEGRRGRSLGAAALITFGGLLWTLPVLGRVFPDAFWLREFGSFFRVGSLVFGGGHVVLPLLQVETVDKGWINPDRFVAGYGAAQALPGPLFAFAGYLGAAFDRIPTQGWGGGALCLVAIFLPSALLIVGTLPFWEQISQRHAAQAALRGANAAVVGLLLAALYDPMWKSAVHSVTEFLLALVAFVLLMWCRVPSWLVVSLAATAGWLVLR